jgi:hypothetical protein
MLVEEREAAEAAQKVKSTPGFPAFPAPFPAHIPESPDFCPVSGPAKNRENFRLFPPSVKNTYLTGRPPARVLINVY